MYRTGDLARLLPDGNIEFIERVDHQVKIHGFRIELGEIESIMLNIPEIQEAVASVLEDADGEHYICGYYVANKPFPTSQLRDRLTRHLPGYMIPAYFVQMDQMPLTPNGKLNRNLLPEPDGKRYGDTEYVPPRNSTEMKLTKIWQDVLGLEQVGIRDNFLISVDTPCERRHSLQKFKSNCMFKFHCETYSSSQQLNSSHRQS